jgi:class 3 adenylate cyclase
MLTQPDSMQPSLDYHHNQVTIKYAAAYYNAPEQTTYSTFLEGQDANWSQWSNKPFKEYMNLKEGRYHFKVKARNVYGNESSEALYSFSVQPPWYRTFWAYLFYLICAGFGVWGIAVLYSLRLRRQKNQLEGLVVDRTREIAEEKQKSDNLLLNILPEATATELKNQGFATSRSYDKVSVLFTDFVSFTSISETMTAEELVREIDVCFSAFDAIIEREGIEKIKTIGDAYMCAAGLDPVLSDPEIRIVRAGLAIRDFISQHNAERSKLNLPFFQIRIGIHTGRIVAGVVGKKKFAFDIWGDTVNIASRIESSSEPDCINVSATTYEFIKNHFECDHRGMIEAKNKGKLEMYFVRGILEKQIEKSDS